jgi:hypothetical protein
MKSIMRYFKNNARIETEQKPDFKRIAKINAKKIIIGQIPRSMAEEES